MTRMSRNDSPDGGMASQEGDPVVSGTSRMQDAVRLLLLVDGAGETLPDPPPLNTPPDAVAVLRTQVALQKLDFWLRNPDYLANTVLDRYELTGDRALLLEAEAILESDEPEVRRYPMLRYRFGAYEPLDEAMSVLSSAGLVVRRRDGTVGHTRQHNYYVTSRGRHVARDIVGEVPALRYYVDRVKLLVALTAGLTGTELKDMQYQQDEYANTPLNSRIAPITPMVRQRLAGMLA
jgi:hypothetical protein